MCYHVIGYAFLFGAINLIHHTEMEELLNKNEFSLLKISTDDIEHHPEIFMQLSDDEIFYDGNYYDVKHEVTENGFTFFSAIKDVTENNWHQQLSEAQTNTGANHADGKSLKSIVKIFSPEWFSVFQFQFVNQNSLGLFSFYSEKNISSGIEEVFLPPPRV